MPLLKYRTCLRNTTKRLRSATTALPHAPMVDSGTEPKLQKELWGRTKVTNAIDSTAGLVGASMRKLTRCILLGSVVSLALVASRPAYAQNPCWDHEAKPNADYPEIDSKCVHSDYSSDRAKFTAEVPGPGMNPGNDPDPICNGLDSSVGTVTC